MASRRPIAADDVADRVRQTERARFAAQLDGELLVACRSEAAARRHVGELSRRLLRERSYQRLGFARLSDYARERLGLSARTIESAAWVADHLERLPAVAAAFDRSEIRGHARAPSAGSPASTTSVSGWSARVT